MSAIASGIGIYRAGEKHVLLASRLYKPDGTKRGILYFHGAGADAWAVTASGNTDKSFGMAEQFPVCSFDAGDPTSASGTTSYVNFGNDNAITSSGSMKTFMQTAPTFAGSFVGGLGCKTDKIFIYAGSMGVLPALNYAISLATPSTVIAAIGLAVPVGDLDSIYQNDRGGYRATVAAAYGVTYPTAIPNLATHSPAAYSGANLAKLTMPIQIWASTDDPLGDTYSFWTTWAGTVGANVTVNSLGAVGHSGNTIPPADVRNFFAANTA